MNNPLLKQIEAYLKENYKKGATFLPTDPSLTAFYQSTRPPIQHRNSSPIPQPIIEKPKKKIEPPPPSVKPKKVEPEESMLSTSEFAKLYQKIAPSLSLRELPTTFLPDVPVFFDPSQVQHEKLIRDLSKAIDTKLTSSACVDINQIASLQTAQPKLVIIPKALVTDAMNLAKHKTILLEDLESYEGNPSLKRALWERIKQALTTA